MHGLSSEFLASKPLFTEVVEEFLEFIGDAPLVIHNASFDISFINAELDRIKRQPISRDRLVDTLLLARRKHPGVSNRLDDLCSRYAIDNSRRTKHGALLDAELSGRSLYRPDRGAAVATDPGVGNPRHASDGGFGETPRRQREVPLAPRITDADREDASRLHRHAWATSRSGTIFSEQPSGVWPLGCLDPGIPDLARLCAGSGLCRGLPLHVLAVQADEIDGIEHQRRETAVAHRGRDDFAREREQQAAGIRS